MAMLHDRPKTAVPLFGRVRVLVGVYVSYAFWFSSLIFCALGAVVVL